MQISTVYRNGDFYMRGNFYDNSLQFPIVEFSGNPVAGRRTLSGDTALKDYKL